MFGTNQVELLTFANRRFFATFAADRREAANKCANANGGVVRPFSVEISKVNPTTNEVTDWKRGEGFSVWI